MLFCQAASAATRCVGSAICIGRAPGTKRGCAFEQSSRVFRAPYESRSPHGTTFVALKAFLFCLLMRKRAFPGKFKCWRVGGSNFACWRKQILAATSPPPVYSVNSSTSRKALIFLLVICWRPTSLIASEFITQVSRHLFRKVGLQP